MSEIWQLYTKARTSGRAADITAYSEAVASSSPNDFLTGAEYIIRSSAGLSHFRPLAEKYGLSIPFANKCESILESAIEKCHNQNANSSAFEEALNYLQDRKKKYQVLYDMYEWYSLDDEDQYLETYYGTTKGKSNRLYPGKMLDFGEESIPDLIITSYEKGNLQKLLEYYTKEWSSYDGIFCEWMMRGLTNLTDSSHVYPYIENACSTIVNEYRRAKERVFRESVIMNEELHVSMSENERIAYDEYKRFCEFSSIRSDSIDEDIQNELYSLSEDVLNSMDDDREYLQEDFTISEHTIFFAVKNSGYKTMKDISESELPIMGSMYPKVAMMYLVGTDNPLEKILKVNIGYIPKKYEIKDFKYSFDEMPDTKDLKNSSTRSTLQTSHVHLIHNLPEFNIPTNDHHASGYIASVYMTQFVPFVDIFGWTTPHIKVMKTIPGGLKNKEVVYEKSMKLSYETKYDERLARKHKHGRITIDGITLPERAKVYTKPTVAEGDEVSEPVDKFRTSTGIEVIHKCSSRKELNQICANWLAMDPEDKKKSEKYCMDHFKKHNIELFIELSREEFKESGEVDEPVDEVHPETGSNEEYKPVFVILKSYYPEEERQKLLQQPDADESKYFKDPYPIIHKVSRGDNYGHAVISFDLDFNKSYEVFPQGLIRTKFDESWHGTQNIYISAVFVKPEDFQKMLDKCEDLVAHPGSTEYAFSNFVKAFVGRPTRAPGHHICSAFVGYILNMSDPKNLHIHYDRMRPEDLTVIPRSFHIADTQNIDTYQEDLPKIRQAVDEVYRRHEYEIREWNNELPKLMVTEEIEKLGPMDNLVDKLCRKLMKIPEPSALRAGEVSTETESWYDEDLESFSIYVEAGDDMGLMLDSYSHLGKVLGDFIKPLKELIGKFNKDPVHVEVSLDEQINGFKEKINIHPQPKEIDIRRINVAKKKVSDFQRTIDGNIKVYASCKDAMAYGGNLWRGIIRRPKVLTKNIDSAEYGKINSGIRQINRALDWFEKALIDLSNLASQDMNVLNIVDRVYRKKNIYEATDPGIIDHADSKLPDVDKSADALGRLTNPVDDVDSVQYPSYKSQSNAPTYLKQNHDMVTWGEDDTPHGTKKVEDDFRRPSAEVDDHEPTNEKEPDVEEPAGETPAPSSNPNVSNYYYYTYTNSNNKNTGSFNRTTDNSNDYSRKNVDSSHHTTTTSRDDHSHHIDNSRTSNSRASQTGSNYFGRKPEGKDQFHHLESAGNPWELSFFVRTSGMPTPINQNPTTP